MVEVIVALIVGAVVVVCLLASVVIQLVIGLAWVIWEHREEIAQALLWTGKGIALFLLSPPYVAAWLFLHLFRDRVVYAWSPDSEEWEECLAILMWTVGFPVLLTPLWSVLASFGLILAFGPFFGIVLAALSTGAFFSCYYYIYFEKPPQHYNWPLFVAQQHKMWFAAQCEYLVRRLRLRLAFASLKAKLVGLQQGEVEDGE